MSQDYQNFLKSKIRLAESTGFSCDLSEINPAVKPHNKLMIKWMVEGGRRACFASFGLHKTVTQLETIRIMLTKTGGRGLIICPLGVRAEFIKDAKKLLKWDILPKFIRKIEEAEETGITDADIAEFFQYANGNSYANSARKEKLDCGIIKIFLLCKERFSNGG